MNEEVAFNHRHIDGWFDLQDRQISLVNVSPLPKLALIWKKLVMCCNQNSVNWEQLPRLLLHWLSDPTYYTFLGHHWQPFIVNSNTIDNSFVGTKILCNFSVSFLLLKLFHKWVETGVKPGLSSGLTLQQLLLNSLGYLWDTEPDVAVNQGLPGSNPGRQHYDMSPEGQEEASHLANFMAQVAWKAFGWAASKEKQWADSTIGASWPRLGTD